MDTASIPSLGGVVAQKYRIDREIGRGGMGIVYAATDLTLGRIVALKLLISAEPQAGRLPTAIGQEDRARFMREARATASLRGEHVAQVYEAGVTPQGVPFLAMELLHGEDLDRYVQRRGPLPYGEACDLLIQACVALAEAHQLGIVHRDLKPQNFFIQPPRDATGPKLKVLDFGISKVSSEADLALTQTSMTMGSPRYMSPEQVRSSKYVDARADIWALGAVLFEAIAGRPLFNESTASALHAQIIADAATPLRHVRVDAPGEIEQIILRCVEKDPARRFATTLELAQALAPFATPAGRDVAGRLLAAHGFTMPTSVTSQAVPYPAGTPGYAPTGHPVSHPAARRPPAKSGSLLWLWILLGSIALLGVLAVVIAAVSAMALGAAVSTAAQLPSGSASPDQAPPADDPSEAPDTDEDDVPAARKDASATPRVHGAALDAGARAPGPSAAESERQELARRNNDQGRANDIRQQLTFQDARTVCMLNQGNVDFEKYAPYGPTVAASISACERANDNAMAESIRRRQANRARNAKF